MPETSSPQSETASTPPNATGGAAILGALWFAALLLLMAGDPLSPILDLTQAGTRPHWLLLLWGALLWAAFIQPLGGGDSSRSWAEIWLIPALLALPAAVAARLEPIAAEEWGGGGLLLLAVAGWSVQLARFTPRGYYSLQAALFFLPPLMAFYQAELAAARLGEFTPLGGGRLASPLAAAVSLAGGEGSWWPTALAYAGGAVMLMIWRRLKRGA